MQTSLTTMPLRIIQLPIDHSPQHEQKQLAVLLKMKLRLCAAAPHLDRGMLDNFLQRLLPVTCRSWMFAK